MMASPIDAITRKAKASPNWNRNENIVDTSAVSLSMI
jgi:hypothetical protein